MDFSAWNPPHTLIVIFGVLAFAAQVGIYFYRTAQNDKKLEKLNETLERHEERIDKRFEELNQRLSSMDDSIRQLKQNYINHLTHHHISVHDVDRLSV